MSRTSADRDATDTPRAAALIADPDNIGWPLALIYAVAVLVDQTIGLGARWDEGFPGVRALEILASLAATLLLLWLAKLTYLRSGIARRHVSIMVATTFLSVLIGTVAGRIVVTSAAPADATALPPFSLDRAIYGTAVLLISMWVLGSLRAFRTAVDDLQSVQQQLTATRTARQEALAAERDNVIAPISSALRDLARELPGLSAGDASLRIQTTAQELVRPVSHELIGTTTPIELPPPEPLPRPSWRQTLGQVAATPLMLPKVMALAMTLLIGRLSSFESGTLPERPDVAVTVDGASLLRALAQLVVVFLAVWLATSVASRILRPILPGRTPAQRWLIVLASVPVAAVIAQVLVLGAFSFPALSPETQSALRNPLVFIVPLVLIAAIAGLIRTAQTRLADILHELQERNAELAFEVARLNEELWMQRRSLSKRLHGSVQGTLNSAALLLARTPKGAEGAPSRADVMRRLQRAMDSLESTAPDDLDVAHELTQIEQTWQGICTIDMDVDADTLTRIQADPLCAASFVDIVGEAAANAVIHGGATRINFTVTEQGPREVRIDAVDDGSGVTDREGGGLGSQILREACTAWGLSSDGATTRLFAVVPLQTTS